MFSCTPELSQQPFNLSKKPGESDRNAELIGLTVDGGGLPGMGQAGGGASGRGQNSAG